MYSFYTIRIQRKTNGTETRNMTPFETHDEAEIHFHKCLAADMGNKDMESVIVCVMDESCNVWEHKFWVAPTPEPKEPAEETVEEGGEK